MAPAVQSQAPYMRQLLDSGTWHQQQLIQLAAFLTPPHTVVYFTAGINSFFTGVPRRLFFAAQQRIAITLSPNYYQKMQRFTTRKNQEEHGPDVK